MQPSADGSLGESVSVGSEEAVGTNSESSEDEAVIPLTRTHQRKSSWVNDNHPKMVWGDGSARQQLWEEIRLEHEFRQQQVVDDEDDDEDEDDGDMQYGLDPGFVDIDEELRVVEGLISEHMNVKESQVPNDTHEKVDVENANCIENDGVETSQNLEHVKEVIIHPHGSTQEDQTTSNDSTSSPAEQQDSNSQGEDVSANAVNAPPLLTLKTDNLSNVNVDKASPSYARLQRTSSSPRVRLVELPDYLATVAREHKRQLLEKQRHDLEVAAQAANAREAKELGATKAARSQHMIRRGYLGRLGIAGESDPSSPQAQRKIDMGANARRAAIASARTRRRPPSMRIKLRQARKSSKKSGFIKAIKSWIGTYEDETQQLKDFDREKNGQGRNVIFAPMVDVFFIPARTDYPAKIKHAIWHTRSEFVEMVVGNMDQVELEMHQEAEARKKAASLGEKVQLHSSPIS